MLHIGDYIMAKRTIKTKALSSAAAFDPKAIDAGLIAQAKQVYTATFEDEPETTLSDSEVWAAIVAVKNSHPHLSGGELLSAVADEMDSMESDDSADTDAKPIDIAKLPQWIKSAANKLNKDAEAIGQFEEILKAEDTRKRGPIMLFHRCLKDFAKTQTLPSGRVEYTECEMDDWAEPLSYNEGEKEITLAGAEYYIGKGASKRTLKNTGNSTKAMDIYRREGDNASRYMDLAMALDIGKKIAQEREAYRLGSLENPTGPYVKYGRKVCEEEYLLRVGRLKSIATQLRIVKNIWDQWRTLQNMEQVYPAFLTVDGDAWVDDNDHSKGKVQRLTTTHKPLQVVKKSNPSVYTTFGPSSFNALKLDVAKKKGGSFEDVVTSGKKPKSKKGDEKKGTASAAPAGGATVNWQINDYRNGVSGLANFLSNPSNAIEGRKSLRGESSDEILAAWGSLFTFMYSTLQTDLRTDGDLCKRLDKLMHEKTGTFRDLVDNEPSDKHEDKAA